MQSFLYSLSNLTYVRETINLLNPFPANDPIPSNAPTYNYYSFFWKGNYGILYPHL